MKQYYLSVCAIVRNESLYLEEWLEFLILQGVEHFFLYENESTDNTWSILKRYESLGLATIEKVKSDEGYNPQLPTYNKCLKEYGHKTKWLAFLDVDEFLYCDGGKVSEDLTGYEEYPALAVNWILYGSSGHADYTKGLVIDRFTMRSKEIDKHVKSIVQPEFTIGPGVNAHYFRLKGKAVNELEEELPEQYHFSRPTASIFRINHYHTKSKAEYLKRKDTGRPDVDGVTRAIEQRFKAHDVNEIEDLSTRFYSPLIIQAISDRRDQFLEKLWNEKLEGRAWQVKEEFLMFLKWIMDNDVKTILEIGTHKGGSALGFLEVGCKVVSIDIIEHPEIKELKDNYPNFTFFLRDAEPDEDYMYFDLLWIDGEHSYEECMKDFEEFYPLVKADGYVAFHDVLRNELHERQNCEVWKVIDDIKPVDRLDFITQDVWGGITVVIV